MNSILSSHAASIHSDPAVWHGLDVAKDAPAPDLDLAAPWAIAGFSLLARGSYAFPVIDRILTFMNEHGTAQGSEALPRDVEALDDLFWAMQPDGHPDSWGPYADASVFVPTDEDLEWKSVMDARDQAEEDLAERMQWEDYAGLAEAQELLDRGFYPYA